MFFTILLTAILSSLFTTLLIFIFSNKIKYILDIYDEAKRFEESQLLYYKNKAREFDIYPSKDSCQFFIDFIRSNPYKHLYSRDISNKKIIRFQYIFKILKRKKILIKWIKKLENPHNKSTVFIFECYDSVLKEAWFSMVEDLNND